MKMTVRDCLKLDAFKDCTVVAGKRNLGNPVKSISVMDSPDIKVAIKSNGAPDRLVLTSLSAMDKKPGNLEKIVKGLKDQDVAALGIFRAKSNELEDGFISSAENLGLPILLFKPENESGYSEIIEQVMGKILLGDDIKNNLINNTVFHLMDFERHKSFPAALKEAALINDFQTVLVSKDFNPILVVESRHNVTVDTALRKMQRTEDSDGRGIYSTLNVDEIAAYWGTINIGDEEYFLLLVDNEEQYSPVEITKLAEIIELAIGMWKYTPVRDVKAELIKALMRGNRSLAYSLRDDMDLDPENIVSVFFARGIASQESVEIIEAFEESTGYRVMTITEGDESYGMIVQGDKGKGKKEEDRKSICISLYDSLKEQSKDIRIFHNTGVESLETAADAFRLINETWTFVENVFPYKRVFSKFELVLVSNCISIQVQGGYIKKNFEELLGTFEKEMGENKAKQLMDTLETFVLDAGLNGNQTAQFMGIHANTVQYRLKRINEVLGVDITGNRVIPGLTTALALKRLERVIE